MDEAAQPSLGVTSTSRLALASALCACACGPVGAGFAVLLGVLALRQMAIVESLTGRGSAWLGILVGGAQIAAVAAIGVQARDLVRSAHPVAAQFVTGLARGDPAAIDASSASRLKPVVGGENLRLYGGAFAERLGEVQQVRYRAGPLWKLARSARVDPKARRVTFTVEYELDLSTGVPAQAALTMVHEYGELRVLGFRFASPGLRNLELPMEASAEAETDLRDYGDGRSQRPRLKTIE